MVVSTKYPWRVQTTQNKYPWRVAKPTEAITPTEITPTAPTEIPREGIYISENIKVMPNYAIIDEWNPLQPLGYVNPETGELKTYRADAGQVIKNALGSIWKNLPVTSYYWQSPEQQRLSDYKKQLLTWAKNEGIENPEQWVNDVMTPTPEEERGELIMRAVTEEEIAKYKTPPPLPSIAAYTTSWAFQGYTKGEQFIADWVAPLLLLSLLPSAGVARAELAPVVEAGGVAGRIAQVTRVVLKPLETFEQIVGRAPSQIFRKISNKIWTQTQARAWSKLDRRVQKYALQYLDDVLRANPDLATQATPEAISHIALTIDDIIRASARQQAIAGEPFFISTYQQQMLPRLIKVLLQFAEPAKSPAAVTVLQGVGYTTQEIAKMSIEQAWNNIVVKLGVLAGMEALLGGAVTEAIPTTAMAEWGGITESQWLTMSVPDKVTLVTDLGLEGKVASKEWAYLTKPEKDAISGVKPALEAKEPWQMTLEEFMTPIRQEMKARGMRATVGDMEQHRAIIQQALSEGKPVPAKVLKDYPDLPKAEVPPEVPKVSEGKLRQSIMATVKTKGLSETAYRKIFRDIGGAKSLRDLSADKLTKVLEAVKRARPVTIGQKNVITPRTEQEIQATKQYLIEAGKLSEADYDSILRILKLSTDRYIDRTAFITETQGRNVIKAMKRKSLMGYAFVERRIADLIDNMKPPNEPPKIITSESLKRPFGDRFRDALQAFTLRSYRVERILYALDGYQDTGIWQDTFYKPVNEATSARIGEVIEWQDKFLQFTKENNINIGRLFSEKEDFGGGVILTPEEKIYVYLSTFNEDNLRHIKVGNKFSDDLIRGIVNSLTNEDKLVANFQQDYYKQGGLPLAEIYKYMTGKELELVENYLPIKIDWRADPEVDWWQLVAMADSRQFMAKWASSMIPKGFLSARTHEAIQAVDLRSMSIWWNHLELTAHYKNFAPVINDLQLIMNNPRFKYNLQNTQGRQLYQVLDKWIKQVADVNPLRATNYAEQMMRTLRVNAVAAVLGINFVTALKQFPSFVAGASEIGIIPSLRGVMTFMAHPKETTKLMKQLSPQIYARTMEREIAEAKLRKSLSAKLTKKLSPQEAFMILTTSMDRLAVNSLWRGGFDEYLRKYPTEIKEAAEYASRAIRRTQPFFSVKDLAEYYRSGEFMKVLTIFTNQLNQYWNMARFEMFGKFKARPTPGGFADLVKRLILGIIIPAIMIGIIARGRLPKDVDDAVDDTKDDVVRTALSMFPIFGQWLSAGFQGWSEGQGLISTQIFEQMQQFVYNLNQKEWARLALQLPELTGYIFGIPTAQPKRTVMGILDLIQGNTDNWLRLIYSEYTLDKPYRDLIESWQNDFDTYYEQPSPRYDYREDNPEIDAKLFIANKVSTLRTDEAKRIALELIEENDIDTRRISAYEKVFGEKEVEEIPEEPKEITPSEDKYPWQQGGITPNEKYPWRR